MDKNLEATSLDVNKIPSQDQEVDALIEGALKELEATSKKVEKSAGEPVLKATPIPVKEKKQEPKQPKEKEEENRVYEQTFKDFRAGIVVPGTVAKIDSSGVLVDIGYKSEGKLPSDEVPQNLKIGDKINVMIEKLEDKEGNVVLSKKKADFEVKWKEAFDAYKNKTILEAKVTSAVLGGLVVDFNGIRGFIPASQVTKPHDVPLQDFVGKIVPVKIIEINRRQSKIILSHKLGAIDEGRHQSSKLFDELEVGQVRRGVVKSIKSFGAFVDLGGVEGLIHLSELSWKRVKHPSEVLKVGQELDVFVVGVDKTDRKVALGLKELQPDPWAAALDKYHAGQVVKVKILRLAKFGAFAEIEEGLEGLIHISELSKERIDSPDKAVNPGDTVDAKILRIIPEEQKIGLSIKEAQIAKEKAQAEELKKEESKVTIGEIIAEKERQKTEREAEFEATDEIPRET